MGQLKGRVRKLEQEVKPRYETLTLADGTSVSFILPDDWLDAFCALCDDADHWLLDAARQVEEPQGAIRLLRAIDGSLEGGP